MPSITYQENGTIAYFNGLRYRKDKKTGYYLHTFARGTGTRLQEKEFHCEQCGKTFTAISNGKNRFCSNNCKSKHRRNNGIDNEERVCPVCEKVFKVNKYAKTICCSRTCGNIYRSKNK